MTNGIHVQFKDAPYAPDCGHYPESDETWVWMFRYPSRLSRHAALVLCRRCYRRLKESV